MCQRGVSDCVKYKYKYKYRNLLNCCEQRHEIGQTFPDINLTLSYATNFRNLLQISEILPILLVSTTQNCIKLSVSVHDKSCHYMTLNK